MSLDDTLALDRSDFLALLTGAKPAVGARAATMVEDMKCADATVSVTSDTVDTDTLMWLGPTYTTVVTGNDPVTVRRIRTANTPFAVIAALDLKRTGQDPRALSRRWRVRCSGLTEDRWELIDRSPDHTWFVTEHRHTTRLRRTSMSDVLRRVCATLEPLMPPT